MLSEVFLDLTNDYLQNLHKELPGVGADFLALLADGASRAMRGERVYASLHNTMKLNTNSPKVTGAQKVTTIYMISSHLVKSRD